MINKGKKPVVIIQARMASTRLPGKIMMELAGKPLIDWVINAAKEIKNADAIVVATTTNEEDSRLAKHLKGLGVNCFRGSSEDVLGRFYKAALEFGADPIIRLCADSPLIDAGCVDDMISTHLESGADLTHCTSVVPLGSAGEVISMEALIKTNRDARKIYQREHVTPYIHENPEQFRIETAEASDWMRGGYRLTVDESLDIKMFTVLFQELKVSNLNYTLNNALTVLKKRPDIAKINGSVMQRDWRKESSGQETE